VNSGHAEVQQLLGEVHASDHAQAGGRRPGQRRRRRKGEICNSTGSVLPSRLHPARDNGSRRCTGRHQTQRDGRELADRGQSQATVPTPRTTAGGACEVQQRQRSILTISHRAPDEDSWKTARRQRRQHQRRRRCGRARRMSSRSISLAQSSSARSDVQPPREEDDPRRGFYFIGFVSPDGRQQRRRQLQRWGLTLRHNRSQFTRSASSPLVVVGQHPHQNEFESECYPP